MNKSKLPIVQPDRAEDGASQARRPAEAPSRSVAEAAGRLILLVEDSPTTRLILSRQMLRAGYQADAAEDGPSALEAMERHRYGLVLTDIQIPGMDGCQLAEEIRKIERQTGRARIPILAITAADLAEERERCLAAGMDDCLRKPLGIPGLEAILRKWSSGGLGDRPAQEAGPVPGGNQGLLAEPCAPVDLEVLTGLTQGGLASALTILFEFREATRNDLVELKAALTSGSLAGVARWAHRIKGASLMVGAKALSELAGALERAARSGDARKLGPFVPSIETAFASLDRFTDEQTGNPRRDGSTNE